MDVEFLALAGVWLAMMAAMMLPSALPVVAVFHHAALRHRPQYPGLTWLFSLAYGTVWLVFSLLLAGMQWKWLHLGTLLPMSGLTALLFILAAVYQFSPWKQSCLKKCRSPYAMLMTQWSDGPSGAVMMGLRYGALCVGCCWALMLLMFGVGMMTLVGMVVITAMVTLEKVLPVSPRVISRVHGILLLVWAMVVLITSQIRGINPGI